MSTKNANNATEAPQEVIVEAPISVTDKLPSIEDFIPESMQPYWELVQSVPFLDSAIVFLVFYFLAFVLRRYVLNLIISLTGKTETDLDDGIIELLRKPLFTTVVLFGLLVALAMAGLEKESWLRYLTPIILSFLAISWLRAFLALSGTLITYFSRDAKHFKKIDTRTEPILIIVSKIIILLIGSYILLVIWGVNPVGLLASAGIVGIAVGFAAKDTLANLFSGMFILADRPYNLGDYINLDGGERGKVTHIGIRSTRVLTRDDIEVTIPNGVIGSAKVINESGGPHQKMRVRINLQCAYESDLEQVCGVLQKIMEDNPYVCEYPAPRVRVRGFGDSGIDIQAMGWIDHPQDRGRVSHELLITIHQEFNKANIEIPYPKREITIYKTEPEE